MVPGLDSSGRQRVGPYHNHTTVRFLLRTRSMGNEQSADERLQAPQPSNASPSLPSPSLPSPSCVDEGADYPPISDSAPSLSSAQYAMFLERGVLCRCAICTASLRPQHTSLIAWEALSLARLPTVCTHALACAVGHLAEHGQISFEEEEACLDGIAQTQSWLHAVLSMFEAHKRP